MDRKVRKLAMSLERKTIFITGASRGIGRGVALCCT